MKNLISELQNEHIQILDVLDYVNKHGIYSPEGQEKLIESKMLLLAHLKKEDRLIYPVLRDSALKNETLQKTLDSFAKEMEGITGLVSEFYFKYPKNSRGLDFARDFGRLFAMLQTRIGREERILYPQFLNVAGNN